MISSSMFDDGLPINLWCYCAEYQAYIYNNLLHTSTNEQNKYLWTNSRTRIHDLHFWSFYIYLITHHNTRIQSHTLIRYFMGISSTPKIIKKWDHKDPLKIHYFKTSRFDKYTTVLPNGDLSPGQWPFLEKPHGYQ